MELLDLHGRHAREWTLICAHYVHIPREGSGAPDRPAVVRPGWLVEPHHYPPSTKDGIPVDPAHHSDPVHCRWAWLCSNHHHFHASSDARKGSAPGLVDITWALRADHQSSLGSWIVSSFMGPRGSAEM